MDFSAVEEETNVRLDKYRKVLSIGCLIDTMNGEDMKLVEAWTAQYASIRKWASTASQRQAIRDAINAVRGLHIQIDHEKKVKQLLACRHFVVLQGAPGTGKTFLAEKIAEAYDKVFFTQFHKTLLIIDESIGRISQMF